MDRDALEQWLEEGLSLEQIGQLVGRSPSTVSYWLARYGLRPAHGERHAPRGGISRDVLAQLVAERRTTRQMAAARGVSQSSVAYWLRRRRPRRRGRGGGVPRGTRGTPGAVTQGDCPKHGRVDFIRRRDDAWRCSKCRTEMVSQRRRRVKEVLVAEAGGCCAVRVRALPGGAPVPPPRAGREGLRARGARREPLTRRGARRSRQMRAPCANCHAEVEAGLVTLAS